MSLHAGMKEAGRYKDLVILLDESTSIKVWYIFWEKKILKFILRWLILFDIDFTNLSIRNKSVARLIIQPRQRVSMIGLKIFVHTHVTSDID